MVVPINLAQCATHTKKKKKKKLIKKKIKKVKIFFQIVAVCQKDKYVPSTEPHRQEQNIFPPYTTRTRSILRILNFCEVTFAI